MSTFVHTHIHTEYSLLEGAIPINSLVKKLKKMGMQSCAITDHGNLYGIYQFHRAMQANQLHPVLGQGFLMQSSQHRAQLSVEHSIITSKETAKKNKLGSTKQPNDHYYPINLLCMNQTGYQNLIKLSSFSYKQLNEHPENKPFLTWELLKEYQEGIVVIFPGIQSELANYVLKDYKNDQTKLLDQYCSLFNERLVLEIFPVQTTANSPENRQLFEFGQQKGLRMIASNNCFYLDETMAYPQYILKLMGKQLTVRSPQIPPFQDALYAVKSFEQMQETFADFPPELLSETVSLTKNFSVDLGLKRYYLPNPMLNEGLSIEQTFEEKIYAGLKNKINRLASVYQWSQQDRAEKETSYQKRLEFEAEMIRSMGYIGYFLIVADFVQWAKLNDVPVGPGRGSGAGSLVAYSLDITDIDPIEYDLLFERFLNPERTSMPDFDIDFETEGRERVIEYVKQKYGEDHVCQIATLGTLQARAAVRGVGRVLAIPYKNVDQIAKMIPDRLGIKLQEAIDENQELNLLLKEGEPEQQTLLQVALKLEGMAANLSTHAAGVVIMSEPITNLLPMCLNSDLDAWQTQNSMEDIESQGAVKFDFLGLKNLSTLQATMRLLNQQPNPPAVELNALPLSDHKVFDMISNGLTVGIFQLESLGMKKFIRRFRPKNFEEIIALIAVYRPGPLQAKMDQKFIDRKDGKENYKSIHPKLNDILQSTYGVIVYQEQIMRIAQILAGFSLGQADIMRRAIGKKKAKELSALREKFIQGSVTSGVTTQQAAELFAQIEEFGNYGFNKSHAAAYALIAYQTAYLKTHFPLEFMASLLNSQLNNHDQIRKCIIECWEIGIKVLPPDINLSEKYFSCEKSAIRYGLLAIKNLGENVVDHLLLTRKQAGKFGTIEAFYEAIDCSQVNIRAMESMIFAGVFDLLFKDRFTHAYSCASIIDQLTKWKNTQDNKQSTIFEFGGQDTPFCVQWEQNPEHTASDENKKMFLDEIKLLGFPFSPGELTFYAADKQKITQQNTALKTLGELKKQKEAPPTKNWKQRERPEFFCLARMIDYFIRKNQQGSLFGSLLLQDENDILECAMFENAIQNNKQHLSDGAYYLWKMRLLEQDPSNRRWEITSFLPLSLVRQKHCDQVKLLLKDPVNETKLQALAATLNQCSGDKDVYLTYHTHSPYKAVVECKINHKINPNLETHFALSKILSAKNIVYQYQSGLLTHIFSNNPHE